jgi:hypothetical protein
MEDIENPLVAKVMGFVSLFIPSFDFWYSTTFWLYVFWGLW